MWKTAFILLLSFAFQRIRAQENYTLSGRITDSIGTALYPGTIQISINHDTLTTISDSTGTFVYRDLSGGVFRLHITMKGYKSLDQLITIRGRARTIHIKSLILNTDYGDLDPVTISRVRPMTISEDTVTYNAAAFPVRDGSFVQDILQRLPGVEVDADGNVIVQGKKIAKVVVNGKEFFGGDVLLAIRNLPADVVSKLQVIDDYGDKARLTGIKVGEPSKILNIVLQTDKRNGTFGHVQAGAGTKDKYSEEAFANRFNGDRQLSASANAADNYPSGKSPGWNGAASYADQWSRQWGGALNGHVNANTSISGNSLQQENFYPGQQISQTQSTTTQSSSGGAGTGDMLTWKPTPFAMLRISPSYSGQHSNQSTSTSSAILESDSNYSKNTQSASASTTQTENNNAGADLYFEKTYPANKRRFSLQGTINYTQQTQNTNIQTNSNILSDNQSSMSFLHTLTTSPEKNLILNFQGNYFLPLLRQSFLEMTYRFMSTQSQINLRTLTANSPSGPLAIVDSLSLYQTYRTLTQQIHLGYLAKIGPLNLNLSADLQPTTLSGTLGEKTGDITSSYLPFIPRVLANWKLTSKQSITFQYQRNTTLPSLEQLNPVTILTNPQYPVAGNPDLKPSYQHSASFHYEYANQHPLQFFGFGASIGYNLTLDPIMTAYSHPKDSSLIIQNTTYINAGKINSAFLDYHFNLPALVHRVLRISGSGNLTQTQTPSITDGILNTSSSVNWTQRIHLQVLVPGITELNASANYSLIHTSFSVSSSIPSTVQSASLTIGGRHFFFHQASIAWQFNQPYVSTGTSLRPAPCALNAELQYDFLRHNKASIGIMGYNLVNSTHFTSESINPTVITQIQTNLIGRYFMATFKLRLERFY